MTGRTGPTPRDVAQGRTRHGADGSWLDEQLEDGPTVEQVIAAAAAGDPTARQKVRHWQTVALTARTETVDAYRAGEHRLAGIHRFETGFALAADAIHVLNRHASGVHRIADALHDVATALAAGARPPGPTGGDS